MRLGNGLWESAKFNNQFQLTELGLGTSAAQTNKLKISYDYGIANNNGNVLQQTITVPAVGQSQGFTATQTYEYDELNRIKSAVETGNSQTWWQQHFRYDRYGNRTVVTEQNRTGQEAFTTSSIVGLNPDVEISTNRIKPKQNSTEQYLFDASGNMTRDDVGNTFTFDAENHQKTYTPVNPQLPQATYYYDGDGKRVKKVIGEEVTIFIYDGAGALAAEYTQNAPVNQNPQTVYTTVDSLGTPRINTNQKGEVVARHDYLPFGDEIVGLGQRLQHQEYVDDDVRQKFTGYEKDKETGLDFAQARYYGNGLGRFTSIDPALESIVPALPQSWNRYAYVLNNPMNLVDPTGLTWWYNSPTNTYKWFENGNAGDGWERVRQFTYQSVDGDYVALDPFSSHWTRNYGSDAEAENTIRGRLDLYNSMQFMNGIGRAFTPFYLTYAMNKSFQLLGRDNFVDTGHTSFKGGLGTGIILNLTVVPAIAGTLGQANSAPATIEATSLIVPVNRTISIGGAGEVPASNVNLLLDRSAQGIPNLIKADGARIGSIFQPGSATSIVSSRLPFSGVAQNGGWDKLAQGAHTVLAPGGRVTMHITSNGFSNSKVVVDAFRNAGFQNVTAQNAGWGFILQAMK